MPSDLELTVAMDVLDRTRPIVEGVVDVEGIDPTVLTLPAPERHRRMLNHAEFDVCELSLASYLASVGEDYPFTAIPTFPHRMFRHGYYFVNANAGIREPADLEGARVGVRRWQNTAAVWMRGIAETYHDVDTTTIEWWIDDEDEVPVDVPEAYDSRRIPDGADLDEALVAGDLDAVMYPREIGAFRAGDPNVERLFPDYAAVERQFYADTELFPLMHVIVIRDDVIDDHPWVPTSVRKAFAAANREAVAELERMLSSRQSLVWARESLATVEGGPYDVLDVERDLWADGLEANRAELETLVSYGVRDGLLDERVDPAALFVESAVEELPEAV